MSSFTTLTSPGVLAAGAAIIAAAWATYLSAFVTRRVQPAVPTLTWWKAAVLSMFGAGGLAAILQHPTAAVVVGVIVPLLVLGSYVDALTMRIPNLYNAETALVITAGVVGVAFTVSPAAAFISGGAGVAALLGFAAISMLSRGGLGFGDVKLAGVLAGALALIDVSMAPAHLLTSQLGLTLIALHIMVWITLSFLFGGVYVTVRLIRKMKGHFPFGPFLAAGWLFTAAATPAFLSILTPFA